MDKSPLLSSMHILLFLAMSALSFISASSAFAVNITVNGTDGASGTPDGGDGQSVTETATSTDVSNVTFLNGGKGGDGAAAGNGGRGGDTSATSTGIATTDSSGATATSNGGQGGDGGGLLGSGGDGGNATASVSAINAGASATVRGGDGGSAVASGNGGDGGTATLGTATSVSSNGDNAGVSASVYGGDGGTGSGVGFTSGNGASVILVNAIDADTAGYLSLIQEVWAGNAGSVTNGASYGAAGDAYSYLSKTSSSSHLQLETAAYGGYTQEGQALRGSAVAISEATNLSGSADAYARAGNIFTGDASSTATAVTFGDGNRARAITDSLGVNVISSSSGIAHGNSLVDVFDRASGGTATSSAYGENAGNQLVTVSATAISSAIGGNVDATARGSSSAGGRVIVFAEQNASQSDSLMVDTVSGSTTGYLSLEQLSRGTGLTTSSLTATNPGGGGISGVSRAEGGDAIASIDITGAGSVDAKAISKPDVVGPSVLGTVFGRSTGDGPVSVSGEVYAGANTSMDISVSDAVDGDTSSSLTLNQTIFAGNAAQVSDAALLNMTGGDAYSSLTRSKSTSSLSITSRASGGAGGSRWVSTGVAGNGGNAEAISSASNTGSTVYSSAIAQGGRAGTGFYGSARGNGGDAHAVASAAGSDVVTASATAAGGSGTIVGVGISEASALTTGGIAQAGATSNGSQATATADAHSMDSAVNQVHSYATTSVANSADATVGALLAGGIPGSFSAFGKNSAAYGVGLPDISDVDQLLLDSVDVANNFDVGGSSDIFGYGLLGAEYSSSGAGTLQTSSSSIEFSLDMNGFGMQQDLLVGFLDNPFAEITGFNSLNFRIEQEGITTIDMLFSDLGLANSYFSDSTLNLGDWALDLSGDNILDLVFYLDFTSMNAGEGAYFDFIVGNSTIGSGVSAVPIPASLWLFGSGLLGLIGISRRKKFI